MQKIIDFDRTGYTALDHTGVEGAVGAWVDGRGVVVSVHEFELVPDLPAGLDDLAALRSGLVRAAASVGIIEADVVDIDGMPALRQLVKGRIPDREHGLAFNAAYTIPRAHSSVVFKVQAAEGNHTGMREAVVFAEVGFDALSTMHPYDRGAPLALPYNAADSADWDAQFPEHPLSFVRGELTRLGPTIRCAEAFRAEPAFTPSPAPKRRWFRRG